MQNYKNWDFFQQLKKNSRAGLSGVMSDRFVESSENRKNTQKDANIFNVWFLTESL